MPVTKPRYRHPENNVLRTFLRWFPDSTLASLHASGKVGKVCASLVFLVLRDEPSVLLRMREWCWMRRAASPKPSLCFTSPHAEGERSSVSEYGGAPDSFSRTKNPRSTRLPGYVLALNGNLKSRWRGVLGVTTPKRSEVVVRSFGWPVPRHPAARNAWLALHDPRWTDRYYPPLGRAHSQTV